MTAITQYSRAWVGSSYCEGAPNMDLSNTVVGQTWMGWLGQSQFERNCIWVFSGFFPVIVPDVGHLYKEFEYKYKSNSIFTNSTTVRKSSDVRVVVVVVEVVVCRAFTPP